MGRLSLRAELRKRTCERYRDAPRPCAHKPPPRAAPAVSFARYLRFRASGHTPDPQIKNAAGQRLRQISARPPRLLLHSRARHLCKVRNWNVRLIGMVRRSRLRTAAHVRGGKYARALVVPTEARGNLPSAPPMCVKLALGIADTVSHAAAGARPFRTRPPPDATRGWAARHATRHASYHSTECTLASAENQE